MAIKPILAVSIFAVTYLLLVLDRFHRTTVALLGACAMLLLKLISQHTAFSEAVDFNVIFLLVGMMVMVNILKETGVFQWAAIKAAKLAKGEPLRVMILLAITTAIFSALLDNVTTVLLLAPVVLLVCSELAITPVPMLLIIILSSNIGGTATLIGDPPNMLVGSAAGLSFLDFIIHLTPLVIVVMAAFVLTTWVVFRKSLTASLERKARIMEFDESKVITDKKLLIKSLAVLGVTLVGFVFHGQLGLEAATVALAGAALLMFITNSEPERLLEKAEWSTLFFFIGLFIVVGGAKETGLIGWAATNVLSPVMETSQNAGTVMLLWVSALLSGIFGNIPYTTAIIPVIEETGNAANFTPIWWALAIGACLGGNATILGAAANIVVVGIAGESGHKITFRKFLKYGLPIAIQSMVIATIYIYLRYLIW